MLVIDPDTCIDCQLCVPECPVHAIYEEEDVPKAYQEYIELNATRWESGKQMSEKKDAPPGAKSLEQVQQEEQDKGWDVDEPRGA